jgi:hypothetical protein
VEEYAGGVQHPSHRRPLRLRERLLDRLGQRRRRGAAFESSTRRRAPAQTSELPPHLDDQAVAPVDSRQRRDSRLGEQAIDRGQRATRIEVGRHGAWLANSRGKAAVNRRDLGPASPGWPGSGFSQPGPAPQPFARPGAPPPPPAQPEVRIAQLEGLIEQFRIDAERYFNGALPIPPEDQRNRIQRELRELRATSVLRNAVDNFRLSGFEARFNSLSEFYGRRLRDREEGRGVAATRGVSEGGAFDAEQGVVLGARPDADAIEALWGGLTRAGGAKIELETFRSYLSRQLDEIRSKTGADSVLFRVVREDGKLKLKAKPVGGSGS